MLLNILCGFILLARMVGAMHIHPVISQSIRKSYEDAITIAGQSRKPGVIDGPITRAQLYQPADIIMKNDSSFFVIERGNHVVREITLKNSSAAWRDFPKSFASCAEIRKEDPFATDWSYVLHLDGDEARPFLVYCADMDKEPKEYLHVNPLTNFANYKCANPSPAITAGDLAGTDIKTWFEKIRIDVTTMTLITDDYHASTKTGSCHLVPIAGTTPQNFGTTDANRCGITGICGPHKAPVLRYGFAGACIEGTNQTQQGNVRTHGRSQIDLQETAFVIDTKAGDQWEQAGTLKSGSVQFFNKDQRAQIYGGGICGWNQVKSNRLKLVYGDVKRGMPLVLSSCQDIRHVIGVTSDGLQTIYWKGDLLKPLKVYCKSMKRYGPPARDYLVLNGTNYVELTCPNNVKQRFRISHIGLNMKSYSLMTRDIVISSTAQACININPAVPPALLTKISEVLRSNHIVDSSDRPTHHGTAIVCGLTANNATTVFDLSGTPFTLSSALPLKHTAVNKTGTLTVSADGKVAQVSAHKPDCWESSANTAVAVEECGACAVVAFEQVELPAHYNASVDEVAVVSTFVGLKGKIGQQDGARDHARFKQPVGLAYNTTSQVLYVADTGNHAIRNVSSNGTVGTLLGVVGHLGNSSEGRLCQPSGLLLHMGLLFFTEACNHVVQMVDVSSPGKIWLVAGSGKPGGGDGVGAHAEFNSPNALSLMRIGSETLLAVSDYENHAIRTIQLVNDCHFKANCAVTTKIGILGNPGYVNGNVTVAKLNHPTGLVFNPTLMSLYISEFGNNVIRELKLTGLNAGEIFLLTGQLGKRSFADGVNSRMALNRPRGMALRSDGSLVIADFGNNAIRMLRERPCPFMSPALCQGGYYPKAKVHCNATDWLAAQQAAAVWVPGVLAAVSRECEQHLQQYCAFHGLQDKACILVNKTCATSNGLPCSGHGACDTLSTGICHCEKFWHKQKWQLDWQSDCSFGDCPGDSTCSFPNGKCDHSTGLCVCNDISYGPRQQCEYKRCPNDCMGNGECDKLLGRCGCYYPWAGPKCDYNMLFPHPVTRIKSADVFDIYRINMTHADRWTLYNIEATATCEDPLLNQEFGLFIMKERAPTTVPYERAIAPQWTSKPSPEGVAMFKTLYPHDHKLWRSLSVCPTEVRREDPRQVWNIGVAAPPGMRYQLQFRIVESLIPLNLDFQVETYGIRYYYFTHLAAHQRKHSTMWLDIHVEAGTLFKVSIVKDICPEAGVIPMKQLDAQDTTWSTKWGENGTTYRIELFSCGDETGEYFVGIDTAGKYLRATAYAQVIEDDHRCATIIPPWRLTVVVQLGEVIRLVFPAVIGFFVFTFLAIRIGRYCYVSRMLAKRHKERLEKERYDALAAADYYGEEQADDGLPEVQTRKVRKATSSFEARKARERRLEQEVMRAQVEAEGLLRGEEKAVY